MLYCEHKEMIILAISFQKLLLLLDDKGINIYHLKRDKVIGTATLDKIRKSEGHIDTRSIESLCAYLDCQPGDIMEYIPEGQEAR